MIDEEDQICGAVVNIRKGQDKLCLWTKDENNREAVVKIGYVYKEDVIILLLLREIIVCFYPLFRKQLTNDHPLLLFLRSFFL